VVDSDGYVGKAHAIVNAVQRYWLMAVVIAAACSGGSKEIKHGGGTGSGGQTTQGNGPTGTGSGGNVVGVTPAVVPDVGCLVTSCAYHAGAGAYFTCLAGGAGTCFHFGGPCTPPDKCMYDAKDRSYKQCGNAVEGVCQQWGAPCTPANGCMYSAADGMHHDKSGALCAP
jgi:hypothetical protein